jgi:hypothetical protein
MNRLKNTVSQTPWLGDKCLSCGRTGLEAMSLASLDRDTGCQGVKWRRHHFPRRTKA